MKKPIYLDYNATTPHAPEVIEAMRPFLETEFGNPSSSHWYGTGPREAVKNARKQVASLLYCKPEEVIFTSGGTESNNHAIRGTAFAMQEKGKHIITSVIEHPAVLNVCRYLEKFGFTTTYLPVDEYGRVQVDDVKDAIKADTVLISIMHANNEVGTIQPIEEISILAKENGITYHTDAAQSAGKLKTAVDELGVDMLSIAGHKLYAPKGIGVLYIREGADPEKLCYGAGQELGKRSGTENVLEIVGLGKACELASCYNETNVGHMRSTRNRLQEGLTKQILKTRINGHPENRLPNTLSISFKGIEANRLLEEIGSEVAASAGAACHAEDVKISHVLEAMNVPMEWAKGTIRFSTSHMISIDEIDRAIEMIAKGVQSLRA